MKGSKAKITCSVPVRKQDLTEDQHRTSQTYLTGIAQPDEHLLQSR